MDKFIQLTEDNIVEFLRFIGGGSFIYEDPEDPDSLAYVYSSKLDVNIIMGEYAVNVENGEGVLDVSIFTEEDLTEYLIPDVIKELRKMLNILQPVVQQGVGIFSVIQDLTDDELTVKCLGSWDNEDTISLINHYELQGHVFELIRENNKITVKML